MLDPLQRVIVGNVVFYPDMIREFLKKSSYYMSYDPNKETITLFGNDGRGGRDLFEIRNASHENAKKLADMLGLQGPDGALTDRTLNWSKWNPIYELWDDGSEDAKRLKMEMLNLGLPLRLINRPYLGTKGQETWAWSSGNTMYVSGNWSVEHILGEIRKDAERYRQQLSSTP